MKIIDIAVCVDNRDPENLGRIRCIRYSSYTGEVERAMTYNAWDDKDLFTAIPFLPNNINFIPEIGQTVKILNYNINKDTTNVEYIAGPFTTRHDFNSQTHSIQVERTSFGIANKHGKTILDENGNYVNENSKGALANHTDYGVYGKYGSDVLFTENGLQLRGGKLISKNAARPNQKTQMLYQPILSKKSATLYLKKFDTAKELKNEETETKSIPISDLKYFVEYSLESLSGDTYNINYYLYLLSKPYDNLYKTNNPSLNEAQLINGYHKLINKDNTTTGATFTRSVTSVEEIYTTIRNDIKSLHYKGLTDIDVNYGIKDIHPFYFRPTEEFRTRTLSSYESDTRNLIFSKISINSSCGPQHGLVFQQSSVNPPQQIKRNIKPVIKDVTGGGEQTFAALKSDKIYFLSTDNNIPSEKPINFESLDKYELTQSNYLEEIEPKTYATVRGENLLNFLRAMFEVLSTHKHNINAVYARKDYDEHNNLIELYKKLEDDILNKSIRIN